MLHESPALPKTAGRLGVLQRRTEGSLDRTLPAGADGQLCPLPAELDSGQRSVSMAGEAVDMPGGTSLSRCEQEVLVLLWKGFTTREISKTLHRSFNTIAMHRRHILRKFCVRTTEAALQLAVEQQLLLPLSKPE